MLFDFLLSASDPLALPMPAAAAATTPAALGREASPAARAAAVASPPSAPAGRPQGEPSATDPASQLVGRKVRDTLLQLWGAAGCPTASPSAGAVAPRLWVGFCCGLICCLSSHGIGRRVW